MYKRQADLQPGGVQEHVDLAAALPDVAHHRGHRIGVGEVHRVVVDRAAGRLDGLDGRQGCRPPLDAGELLVDDDRGRPLAAFLPVSYTHLDVYKRQVVINEIKAVF